MNTLEQVRHSSKIPIEGDVHYVECGIATDFYNFCLSSQTAAKRPWTAHLSFS